LQSIAKREIKVSKVKYLGSLTISEFFDALDILDDNVKIMTENVPHFPYSFTYVMTRSAFSEILQNKIFSLNRKTNHSKVARLALNMSHKSENNCAKISNNYEKYQS
jgi:hypothetical protein